MKSGNILIITLISILPFSVFAQTGNSVMQESMTYEEAVALLTAHENIDEFTTKGDLPEFPTMGKQIAIARQKKDVSISTLAFVAGLPENAIIKIEEDKITPTRDIIAKIEDFLGEEIVLLDNQ